MAREFFKNLPSQETPFNAQRWNGLLNGEEAMGSIVVDDITCKNIFDKKLLVNPQKNPVKYLAIKGKPNTQYTFSSNIPKSFDNTGAYIFAGSGKTNSNSTDSGGVWKGQTRTFTSDNEGYISLGYRIDENISSLNDYWYQIEPGPVATDYVEHKEFENKDVYSTNEQVIGTWINGKPLYRKTISIKTPNTTNNTEVYSFDTNFIIKNYYGFVTISESSQLLPINFYFTNEYNVATYIIKNTGKINMKVGSISYTNQQATISLEYTKTTD